jgi:3-dehydroquinate synthase
MVEDLCAHPPGHPLVLISDDTVAALYARTLCTRLSSVGLDAHLATFPAGESHKSRETKAALEDRLFELGAGREAAIVAVGGGVTGDLAGFTAATWHRGIAVVQVPTTLLAMCDAALGGKTGVDLAGGKNLVGAFHQPSAIYADVEVLATLPETDYRCGFAEMVKSAVIADADLFGALEDDREALARRDPDRLERAIERCLRIKAEVVAGDEREGGRRAILNFGHTVAHALESASGYSIPHGHAVSLGMVVEATLAVRAIGFPSEDLGRLERLLRAFDLPVRWPTATVVVEQVVSATRRDKKARGGRARYALPIRIGDMPAGDAVTLEIDESDLRAAIQGLEAGTA